MKKIFLTHKHENIKASIALVSSKSESNRALILDALTGFQSKLHNLATARDTQTMQRLLHTADEIADVIDAGTTMRFLTAYFSVTNQEKILTGTPRMCQRPIALLVDALRSLGAEIAYLETEGFPPIQTKKFEFSENNLLKIRGDVSSQYISALAMIAPLLPQGLVIELQGEVGSKPYIEMTLEQMRLFGADVEANWKKNIIIIAPHPYMPMNYAVESDWSGASYWFSVVALAQGIEIELLGLKQHSLQGDSVVVEIMNQLGVQATFNGSGFLLTKIPAQTSIQWDFTDCPDLCQTIAVVCAAKQISATFTGIESLKIKETNRIEALQMELAKIGARLIETIPNHSYQLIPASQPCSTSDTYQFQTYDDHRMAMAFAPLAMCANIIIEDPEVVAKSYPSFWNDFEKVANLSIVSA